MKPIKLFTDLSVHLYEGEAAKKRGTPTPITYLTQWKLMGNSEVHGNEIWSCGEYSAVDGKYHILVQPLGGNITNIALNEPLRKVNDVADTIEFPSETEGKALVTRNLKAISLEGKNWNTTYAPRYVLYIVGRELDFPEKLHEQTVILCNTYTVTTFSDTYSTDKTIGAAWNGNYNLISIRDTDVVTPKTDITGEAIFKLTTPTTEFVDAPQIQEAESYTCVISQGGKAVEWSSFETE
jgi:hypothetical protein